MAMDINSLALPPQTEEQKKQQREKITKLMLNPIQEAEKTLIGASSCQHLFKYVSPIEKELEREALSRKHNQELLQKTQQRHSWQQQAHEQMLIRVQLKAMALHEAQKPTQQGNDKQQVNVETGTVSHSETGTKPLNQFDNEFKFSGLLNIPTTKDDWVEVIDAMTKEYYLEFNNSMPTEAQAWVRLCENPPTGYGITANKDNLSITMIGIVKPFNKRSFDRRWAKYTAKSSQI